MDILIITVLIIAAVILFLVELFVIPGISLAGISALVCIIYANYYAFANLGMAAGFITLGISGVACIGSLVWFMRSKMLDKLALKKEVGCVTELIESLTDVFEPGVKKKFITYSCETDIQHKYVIGDETKVREIFINIIGNSVKYTSEGEKISVSVKEEPFEKENYIAYRIIVEDNGIGMSKEYLPHIFEEFSREHTSTESKVTGTGLGLPIVKSLIDMMGGTIEVESQLGCGTKMTVVLPFELASEKQILEEKQKEKEKISDRILGKRVLLAEDNELNAEIAMTVLKENGLKAERAANGKQCIEMLKKMPEDYYDMILMDIQMPEMDGYEATKRIRNLDDARADIPIVAMTANAFEEDKQKALESGMNAHVSKPVDMNMLFKVMTQILKK